MQWLGYLLAASALAGGELTERLEAWKQEIEQSGNHQIVLARIEEKDGAFSVPENTAQRELVSLILAQPGVVEQLRQAYALTVSNQTPAGTTHVVMLNMARREQWAPAEEALLAHEFGHAWIKAKGFPVPVYLPGPTACLTIHAGDVVQHVLIRAEMDRRGIDHRTNWIRALEESLAFHESQPEVAKVEPCDRVKEAALWLDVRLGLTSAQWEKKERYEKALRRRFPAPAVQVDEIYEYLQGKDVTDRAQHGEALAFVFERLRRVGSGTEMALAQPQTGH